jgi:hypothetical protein
VTAAQSGSFIALLEGIPIDVDADTFAHDLSDTLQLSLRYRLSSYDASSILKRAPARRAVANPAGSAAATLPLSHVGLKNLPPGATDGKLNYPQKWIKRIPKIARSSPGKVSTIDCPG